MNLDCNFNPYTACVLLNKTDEIILWYLKLKLYYYVFRNGNLHYKLKLGLKVQNESI